MGGILAFTILSATHAQEKPYTQAGTGNPVPPPPKPLTSSTDANAKSFDIQCDLVDVATGNLIDTGRIKKAKWIDELECELHDISKEIRA